MNPLLEVAGQRLRTLYPPVSDDGEWDDLLYKLFAIQFPGVLV